MDADEAVPVCRPLDARSTYSLDPDSIAGSKHAWTGAAAESVHAGLSDPLDAGLGCVVDWVADADHAVRSVIRVAEHAGLEVRVVRVTKSAALCQFGYEDSPLSVTPIPYFDVFPATDSPVGAPALFTEEPSVKSPSLPASAGCAPTNPPAVAATPVRYGYHERAPWLVLS